MVDEGAGMTQDRAARTTIGDATGTAEPTGTGEPAVDRTVIEQLAGITDAQGFSVLGELLNAFLSAVPARFDALDRALAAGDLTSVADQAHALTGSSASFGARRMADLCRELRAAADRGDLEAAAPPLQALPAEFLRVRSWVVAFRSGA
jgi:HPt (histidine-containing phosphotransfer) domain-containing protein